LLILQIPSFEDCENLEVYLEMLEGDNYSKLLEKNGSKLELDDNLLNIQLLEKLKIKKCISSWSNEAKILGKNKLKVNRKRK